MAGERFTSWLSEKERQRLRDVARDCECSDNFILRCALRALLLGQPIPEYVQRAVEKRRNVSNESNGERRTHETVG